MVFDRLSSVESGGIITNMFDRLSSVESGGIITNMFDRLSSVESGGATKQWSALWDGAGRYWLGI